MPKRRSPCPIGFHRQMVALARADRDPKDLAREFARSARAIRNWVAEADRREGRREVKPLPADPGLTVAEHDDLARRLRA